MKVLAWLLGAAASLPAATYHFAGNGQDTYSPEQAGRAATPWKSLAKLDSLRLAPGDSVLLRRGDTFPAVLACRFSGTAEKPIVFAAYGSGPAPAVSGSRRVAGWKRSGKKIFRAPARAAIDQVFLDGRPLVLARDPNHGYFRIRDAEGYRNFRTDAAGPERWAGAAAQVRPERFSLEGHRIARADTAGRFELESSANYRLREGWGVFFNDALAALDTAGEWYWDSASAALFLQTADGDDPSRHVLEASVRAAGFVARRQSHFVIDHLCFIAQAGSAIDLDSVSDCRIIGCRVRYAGREGIAVTGTRCELERDTVEGAVREGVSLAASHSSLGLGVVRSTGDVDRLGREGFGRSCCEGSGIEAYGDSDRIFGNRVTGSAYDGIRIGGLGNLVEENVIDSSCRVLDDGAGIFVWAPQGSLSGSAGTVIRSNIVLNGVGNSEGAPPSQTAAQGIYLDAWVHGVKVEANTVAGADIGIYLHDTRDDEVTGNVAYGNRSAQLALHKDRLMNGEMLGNVVTGNLFYAAATGQHMQWEHVTETANPGPLARYSGNYACSEDSSGKECRLDSLPLWHRKDGRGSTLLFHDGRALRVFASPQYKIGSAMPAAKFPPARFRSCVLASDSLRLRPANGPATE